MKKKKLVTGLFILFICLLSLTIYTSFSSNIDEQEIVIKSMVPVYDETSTIEVDNNNVVFNDKNQVVKYNVVLENTQDYDVKISDIKLSTPTEEFLDYKVEGINKDDVLGANSTKELTISFETMGIKGWGRNFADELTANISFEKVSKQEEVAPPTEDKEEEVEHPKEEVKVPEKPVDNTEELINKSEKIEIIRVTKDTIEFKETNKLETGDKIAVWLYSEPIFLGYFNVVETNNVKQIVGLEEALSKVEINPGKHNIVLATEEGEAIGYVSVGINEEKEISMDNTQTTPDKEESGTTTKPSTDSDSKDDKGDKVENPYTSNNGLVVVFGVATFITGIAIIILCNKKVAKYTVFILMLSPAFTITNAEEVIEVSIKNNVSFESQNVMQKNLCTFDDMFGSWSNCNGYWQNLNPEGIKEFYISNEINEITGYTSKYDMSEKQNGRVIAYLVELNDGSVCIDGMTGRSIPCYNLYLQADGIIYPNSNASNYFHRMEYLENIHNLSGIDTSNVTNMSNMFDDTGSRNENFTLDLSSFDTSNVTDMSYMFHGTGYSSKNFTLDLSSFDTSNVTDMSYMFYGTCGNGENFTLDLSSFDTSNVTNMSSMFDGTGGNGENFTLDLSNFDTSNVVNMGGMFERTGKYSTTFTLDVSNFDTSNVTNMKGMFADAGYNSKNFTLDLSSFDTSNVTNMSYMFDDTGRSSTNFTLDVSNFDTSNVVNMSYMFNNTGYNSNKFKTSITIKNPNTKDYSAMFYRVAIKEGSQITVNYTSKTSELVDEMIATTNSYNSNVVKGECIDCVNYDIGAEISIGEEKFNVISQTYEVVIMLAQYNIGTDYKQTTEENYVFFSDSSGWQYNFSSEIDIQTWSTNPKIYVNEYVTYLQEETSDVTLSGDLITLKELKRLGCTVNDDYSYSIDGTCENSKYNSWLVNGQKWWTRSASPSSSSDVWFVGNNGGPDHYEYDFISCGVRPVITISKDTLKKLNS